jgi:hypothetical protein
MVNLVLTRPLGFRVDDSTLLLVQDSTAEVSTPLVAIDSTLQVRVSTVLLAHDSTADVSTLLPVVLTPLVAIDLTLQVRVSKVLHWVDVSTRRMRVLAVLG